MAEQMMQEAAGKAIPAGYKQTEVGVIPEDWEVVEFGQILIEFRNGYAFSASGYVKVGTPIITMAQIGLSGAFQFELSKLSRWDSSQLDQLKDFWVRNGDLLIAMTDVTPEKNLIGQMAIARLDNIALLNQRVGLLRLRADIAHAGYFSFLSCLSIWKSYCKGVASLGVQANIGTADIKKAKVYLPIIEEQIAIANVLSDSDALIDALEQLIAKKQAIKSATMQQLLTGRTRLPAFALRPDGTPKGYKPSELGEIPEDWACYTFNDVVDSCSSGATPYRGNKDFYKGTNRWITSGELNYCIINDTIEKISDEAIKKSNLNVHPQGTFLMAITGLEAAGTRGACGIVGRPATTNQSCMAIYPNEKLSSAYLYYWYVHNGENLAFKYCQGTKQLSYTAGLIKKIPLYIPTIKEEQTAIAAILSDMDNELQALTQKLEKARALKQGMMQQLLTGKIRLPLAAGA